MRLPSKVHLPFNFTVRIRQVTDSQMAEEMDAQDSEDIVDGLWDIDARTIYIRRAISKRRQRYILGHELHHALLDWMHECLNDKTAMP